MIDESRSGVTDRNAAAPGDRRTASFLGLMALALRRRRLLFGFPVLAMVATVAISLLLGSRYEAESRFMPEQTEGLASEVGTLAAQLGIDVGSRGQGESVDFYAALLVSNELLRQAVLTEYAFAVNDGRDTLRGNLIELYDIDGEDEEERIKAAVQRLRDSDMNVVRQRSAGLVGLATTAPWPELAERINRRMLELVNHFNLERRRSTAAAEREFLEARTAQAEADLREAEAALQRFVERNRRYAESAETAFEHAGLQRRVDFLQQIHTSLAQSLEKARVQAVRNTPVITVVDRPEGTALKTSPKLLVNGVLGLILGAFLAVAILLGRELLASARRANPEDYAELQAATRETLQDLSPRAVLGRWRDGTGGAARSGTRAGARHQGKPPG